MLLTFQAWVASTGRMKTFNDAVNCWVEQVNKLMSEGIYPDDIVLKGNCFGASISTEVQHKCAPRCTS